MMKKSTAQKVRGKERAALAVSMRKRGASYKEIAEALGYKNSDSANAIVCGYAKKMGETLPKLKVERGTAGRAKSLRRKRTNGVQKVEPVKVNKDHIGIFSVYIRDGAGFRVPRVLREAAHLLEEGNYIYLEGGVAVNGEGWRVEFVDAESFVTIAN